MTLDEARELVHAMRLRDHGRAVFIGLDWPKIMIDPETPSRTLYPRNDAEVEAVKLFDAAIENATLTGDGANAPLGRMVYKDADR